VPRGHARQRGFAGSDDIPPRRDQMHDVAQRGLGDHAMRIVREQGFAADRQPAGYGPIIAFLRNLRLKGAAHVAAQQVLQQRRRQPRIINPGLGIEFDLRVQVEQAARRIASEQVQHLCVRELAAGVVCHRIGRHAIQAVGRFPCFGFEAGQLKFQRQARTRGRFEPRDVGIDAVGERLEDLLGVGCVAQEFCLHVAAIAQSARIQVAGERLRTQHLREPALPRPLPQLHLKQPVLCHDEALREKQIVLIGGIDVRDAPAVAPHAHRMVQAGNACLAAQRRERGRSPALQRRGRRLSTSGAAARQPPRDREYQDAESNGAHPNRPVM